MINKMKGFQEKQDKNPTHIPIIFPFGDATEGGHLNSSRNHADNAILISQISQDEAPLVDLPFNIKLTLSILMTLSLLVGTLFKSIMYSYVFTTSKKNRGGWMSRPINVLTVTSAIIHHVTHVPLGVWYVVNLMTETSVGNTVGFQYCQLMDVIGVYGIIYLSVGSLGIAIYRVLYIKLEYWV